MNPSFFFSLHFLWIILAVVNLVIQLAFFYHDRNQGLFMAKKVTTPMLLFLALLIVVLKVKSFPLIPCAILAAMGIAELGMEGSNVVQTTKDGGNEPQKTSLIVTLAGVLFLLVNVFIGVALMIQSGRMTDILGGLVVGVLCISLLFSQVIRILEPSRETKTQISLYAIGIVILFTGTLADIFRGISTLGIAAAILTASDSLVLVRMGAGFDKNTDSGFRTLLVFLLCILLLYYAYMAVLIHLGSPFVFR